MRLPELTNRERVLLEATNNPKMKRRDVAQTYAYVLGFSSRDRVNWPRVRAAIVDRWGLSTFKWIKHQAWTGRAFVVDEHTRERSNVAVTYCCFDDCDCEKFDSDKFVDE
jgi:hypothetical protein